MRGAPMRSERELGEARKALGERAYALPLYRDQCIRTRDHHGVQDACSDLRELEAAESALEWVLGLTERLNY